MTGNAVKAPDSAVRSSGRSVRFPSGETACGERKAPVRHIAPVAGRVSRCGAGRPCSPYWGASRGVGRCSDDRVVRVRARTGPAPEVRYERAACRVRPMLHRRDLARIWARDRPGMVAQVAVVGDLLATLASGRLPAVYELRLLFGSSNSEQSASFNHVGRSPGEGCRKSGEVGPRSDARGTERGPTTGRSQRPSLAPQSGRPSPCRETDDA